MPKSACGFLAEAAEFTGAAFTQSAFEAVCRCLVQTCVRQRLCVILHLSPCWHALGLAYLWDLGGRVCLLHHLSKLDAGLVHRLVPDQRYLRWQ